MWDRLRPERRAAAEERFERLAADHWGEWSEHDSKSFKFENTFESAMSILDSAMHGTSRVGTFLQAKGYGIVNFNSAGMPVVENFYASGSTAYGAASLVTATFVQVKKGVTKNPIF
ncbi:hypothetical protein CVT24_002159 [Panaeolus cyanescens]|uniref:Uncharacterized protein n=1 Tax=Panaeolus cyanescens TaxID=181874 RepID=A0A409YHT7_9AGAR|nr:hypothetical protein CVT24_002159 [Panaeolus cyanescens]